MFPVGLSRIDWRKAAYEELRSTQSVCRINTKRRSIHATTVAVVSLVNIMSTVNHSAVKASATLALCCYHSAVSATLLNIRLMNHNTV